MKKPMSRIHKNKQPIRRHFIAEWMEAHGLKPADLIEQLNVDKSQVYRWLKGQLPQPDMQERIAALFKVAPEALLRHPDDDWLSRFFQDRSAEDRARIKQAMELAWPLEKSGSSSKH